MRHLSASELKGRDSGSLHVRSKAWRACQMLHSIPMVHARWHRDRGWQHRNSITCARSAGPCCNTLLKVVAWFTGPGGPR